MTIDLRLYLVTDPGTERLDDVVAAAVSGGATCVQVRDKHATTRALTDRARALRATLPAHVAVIVDDDVEAARAVDGVHVGTGDVPPSVARATLGPDAVIGWSINHLDQLGDDTQLAACDYVAVSPVWATVTKPDATEPFGLAGVRAVADLLARRLPLVAIGGIDLDRTADVVRAGADGVAVVSAICGAADPRSAAEHLRRVVDAALAETAAVR
ncbi:thiamine phosphate synthase [Aeromicrobium fastidiosum]|uniref:Thiamine-phosphate synthase n=1 Tax=Aeromicrobium fastidiosum TaxID=52699 RepID=A0A641AH87_9ACTN|nr:thiamine phosphate synthase [Aeromicrobium fastidiosum]KAA1372476.1 thiamine phosphate synthase [Aeromicrobium fastidiosum]MBP2391445.1 thiamine-phosphate pyrophosphorylase [Aeromicrobium fastidiosum]